MRSVLGPGQQNDMAPACDLVRGRHANQLLADCAYDADSLCDLVRAVPGWNPPADPLARGASRKDRRIEAARLR